jgi:ABC-type polysaccharide/polyol phosphate export permease
MYHLVRIFRAPIYEGKVPDLTEVLLAGGVSLAVLLIGWVFFTSKADEFAYRV